MSNPPTTRTTTDLLPCPFCGGADLYVDDDEAILTTSIPEYRWVVCRGCDTRGPLAHFTEDESAEEQWNRRR